MSSFDSTKPLINKAENQSQLCWAWLLNKVLRHRPQLIKANTIAIVATLLSLPIPMLMPLLVDEVLLASPGWLIEQLNMLLPENAQSSGYYIAAVLVMVMLLRLLNMLAQVFQSREFTKIAKRISLDIRQQVLFFLPKIQISEFDRLGSTGISARCITDVDTVERFVSDTLSRFIISLLTIIAIASVLLWLNWQLGLMIILLNPLVIYFSSRFSQHVKVLRRKENAATEAFQQALVDTIDATRELRLAQQEQFYYKKVFGLASQLSDRAIATQWKTEALNKLSFTTFLLGFECFRAMAIFMVLVSDLTVGQIFAIFSYLWYLMGPIQELLNIQYAKFGAIAAMERLNQLLGLETEATRLPPTEIVSSSNLNGSSRNNPAIEIAFKQVDFGFTENPKLLNQLDFQIEKNETIALLAMSGAGKSTLINLLLGFYQPQSGQIIINQQPLEAYGFDIFRSQVGYVPQKPKLLTGTLRDNLTLGKVYDDEKLWQALDQAALSETVTAWPLKLDTDLGRAQTRLSGGQMQRLALARMWLASPQVVILDEATSALDVLTEKQVLSNLQPFLQQRTCIIITHRLNNLRLANRILVLDEGKISQSGNEENLTTTNGLFRQLYCESNEC
ncbi:ABC transporter ATP-binding protein [Shewanella donghaensis]|uniref:ABC transporter ATP-binding protein n=1 Tax=Shewanella donghaensis TaxID=238836 RepID=UPI001D059266|nr:ABC transporter ATP-binding protein [Shewanella donghaensis]